MPYFDVIKSLSTNHYINDGITPDAESVYMIDIDGVGSDRVMPYVTLFKQLDNHLNYDLAYDNETFVMAENTISYVTGTRTGADVFDVTKSLAAGHYINNGVTTDAEQAVIVDTDAANETDLNRTTPAIVYTTTIDPSYYSGNDDAAATDSGGIMDINPYGEAGFFLNDGGLYVGNPINFTG